MSADRLESALAGGASDRRPRVVAYLTAGHPDRAHFLDALAAVSQVADAVEIGVPFTDPMADGVTIQRSSRVGLAAGASLRWLLGALAERTSELRAPIALMSYLNPLLAPGLDRVAGEAAAAGISGFVVPDLPYEESAPLRIACEKRDLALVPLVAPTTPPERSNRVLAGARGFVYAVTTTGTTGGATDVTAATREYLARVRAAAPVPVVAGFGIRSAVQVRALAGVVDAVVVGSALVEALDAGLDPARFVLSMKEQLP